MKKKGLAIALLLILIISSLVITGCSSKDKEVYYLENVLFYSQEDNFTVKEKDNYITLNSDGTYELKESFPDAVPLTSHTGTYTKEGNLYRFSGMGYGVVKDDIMDVNTKNGDQLLTLKYTKLTGLSKTDIFIIVCVISGLLVAGMTVILVFQIRKYKKLKMEESKIKPQDAPKDTPENNA